MYYYYIRTKILILFYTRSCQIKNKITSYVNKPYKLSVIISIHHQPYSFRHNGLYRCIVLDLSLSLQLYMAIQPIKGSGTKITLQAQDTCLQVQFTSVCIHIRTMQMSFIGWHILHVHAQLFNTVTSAPCSSDASPHAALARLSHRPKSYNFYVHQDIYFRGIPQ